MQNSTTIQNRIMKLTIKDMPLPVNGRQLCFNYSDVLRYLVKWTKRGSVTQHLWGAFFEPSGLSGQYEGRGYFGNWEWVKLCKILIIEKDQEI